MSNIIGRYMSKIGGKGGSSKSPAKSEAARINAEKAREARSGWKVLARHKWVEGVTITESIRGSERRFSATIRGYGNWHIWQGDVHNNTRVKIVTDRIREIIRRIDSGDETVFTEKGAW